MQSLSVFDKGIGYLSACLSIYQENCAFFMLYILASVFILFKGDEREKKIFIPSLTLLLLTVYNPVFPLILDRIFDVNSEYYRFFWIAPVVILIPYVSIRIIMMIKSPRLRVVTGVFILFTFVLSGNFLYGGGYTPATNIYKMPDEMIEISEIIHDDYSAEYPKVFLEYEYNMQMRQYDPAMLLTIDREDYLYAVSSPYTEEMLADDEFPQYRILAKLIRHQHLDREILLDALYATGTEYVVLDKMNPEGESLEKLDLPIVAKTENHVIYKVRENEEEFSLVDYSVVYPNEGKSFLYHW